MSFDNIQNLIKGGNISWESLKKNLKESNADQKTIAQVEAMFRSVDTSKDGKISAEEWDKAYAALDKADKNNDGKLTSDELSGLSNNSIFKKSGSKIANTFLDGFERAAEDAHYKEMGLIDYQGKGNKITGDYWKDNKKVKSEEFTVIGRAQNGRTIAKSKGGDVVVIAHNGVILKKDYVKNTDEYKSKIAYNQSVKTRKNAETLADEFYKIADDNSGLNSMKKMQALLDKNVNSDNITAFLDAYDRDKTKHGDSSVIDTITSEVGAGGSEPQRKVLMTIMNKLAEAAKKAGVSADEINNAKKAFEDSLNKEFDATLKRTNSKDMEAAIDSLRGAIAAKQTGNVQKMSDKDAINSFKSDFKNTVADAQKAYNNAKTSEGSRDDWGFAAKTGDTVCGWFGCNTIEDMEKKLGNNAAAVKELASTKTEAEFKTKYKQIFGVEFDSNKIAARDAALANYQQAQGLSSTIKITNGILSKSNSLDYGSLKNEIKSKYKLDDKTVDAIIQNYGITLGKEVNSDNDKKQMLVAFLQDTQSQSSETYRNLTKGKTLEQMQKDVELIHKSAFGTSDLAKDVAQFSENMVVTEMVTEGAFEVAGTVALQFVPGLGQMAAAKLAASAAKWGSRGLKIANAAAKAEKAFSAATKIQQGTKFTSKVASKAAQIGSSMATAGVATAAVDLANGEDTQAVMRKTLMNMSFAGVGTGASQLAPKIMQSFGIADSALANEIAEEVINAAGAFGISTVAGDEYGSTDAFVDIATGITMARLAHAKSGGNVSASKAPEMPKVVYNDAGEVVSGGFFRNSSKKPVALTDGSGWQNFKTNDGEITVINSGGKIYSGKVGGGTTREVNLNPGEGKLLGNTSDGSAIILERGMDGSYTVKHIGGEEKKSWLSRMFSGKTNNTSSSSALSSTRSASTSRASSSAHNVSDKKINKKVKENIAKDKANDPGIAHMSKNLENSLNSNTPLVREFANGTNIAALSKQVKSGDVCAVGSGNNQKLYVNNNGQMVELKMSKETFERMFPKTGMAMLEQKGYNNCWLVSRLNSMVESPTGRAQLYSMIEETANGDILVNLPGSSKPVKFPGGKPVDVDNTRLGEGAAEGVEVIHQAVLTRLLKGADKVDDMSLLDFSALEREANSLSHSDVDATKLLFGKGVLPKTSRKDIIEGLENFKPGQDMASAAWGAHQRSIVDYNPKTQQITYHDPYYGGVDLTCSLDEFLKQNPAVSIKKVNVDNSATASGTNVNSKTNFTPRESVVVNGWRDVATTADGNPIKARLNGDKIFIEKDGRTHEFDLPERGSYTSIRESSTDTYIIISRDKYGRVTAKTSETDLL